MYKYYSSCKLVHGCKQDSLLRNTRHKTARCISMCILTKICSSDCEVNPLIRRACSKPFRGIEYRSEGSHISPVTLALLFCSAILRLALSIKTAFPGTNSVFYKKRLIIQSLVIFQCAFSTDVWLETGQWIRSKCRLLHGSNDC